MRIGEIILKNAGQALRFLGWITVLQLAAVNIIALGAITGVITGLPEIVSKSLGWSLIPHCPNFLFGIFLFGAGDKLKRLASRNEILALEG